MKTLKKTIVICLVSFSFFTILSIFSSDKTLMELNIIAIANAQDQYEGDEGGFTCKVHGENGAVQYTLTCSPCAWKDIKAVSMSTCTN